VAGASPKIEAIDEDVCMRAWGSAPFDNDGALDWALKLRRSGDRDYPVRMPCELEAAELIDT
jgi:Domain of unknown function (DUF4259)